jgi:cysteinyl-tRNA synthetase, unknown class
MKHVLILALTCQMAHAETLGAGPFPVFNQAYQENHAADALPDILTQANGAYVLLDPFSEQPQDWAGVIIALHANGNEVGAYISIGTGEDWRSDFAALKPFLVTTPWDQWAGEYFVTDTTGALPLMQARIDTIAALGFDWVEFDNMDWIHDDAYRQTYGFRATVAEGIAYSAALCTYVHQAGMRCMAKNTVEGADDFDGVLYESYSDDLGWWDAAGGLQFVRAAKPVIINHYGEADCAGVYDTYRAIYGPTLSFICEDANLMRYVHFNE